MEISKDYGTRISSALNRINWDVSYRFEKAHAILKRGFIINPLKAQTCYINR